MGLIETGGERGGGDLRRKELLFLPLKVMKKSEKEREEGLINDKQVRKRREGSMRTREEEREEREKRREKGHTQTRHLFSSLSLL